MKAIAMRAFLISLIAVGSSLASAQTTEIPPPADSPVPMAVYYKVPPGKRTDWLTLYKKYHYPVMQQFVKDGLIKSVKIYQRRFRAEALADVFEANTHASPEVRGPSLSP